MIMFKFFKCFGSAARTGSGTDGNLLPRAASTGFRSVHRGANPTGNPMTDYRNALSYLDSCGTFDEHKLREANRIAGSMMLESDIQMLLQQAQYIIPTATTPGGIEFIRASMRKQLVTFIQPTGPLGF